MRIWSVKKTSMKNPLSDRRASGASAAKTWGELPHDGARSTYVASSAWPSKGGSHGQGFPGLAIRRHGLCDRPRTGGHDMLKITVKAHSSASAEEVLALAGTDFSAHRAQIWPNVTTR